MDDVIAAVFVVEHVRDQLAAESDAREKVPDGRRDRLPVLDEVWFEFKLSFGQDVGIVEARL